MDAEHWALVRRIVEQALAREPGERAAFIDDACVGVPALRDEVEALLDSIATAEAESFLTGTAAALAVPLLGQVAGDDARDADALLAMLRAELSERYAVERELGRGGTAIVFLARDLRHDRDVAIKVLRSDVLARLSPERFLEEIRLTARLAHPYILPLHDSGMAAGVLYYVMPFVAGRSLRARLRADGVLSDRETTAVLRNVASALAHAHAAGVVHRDIKPENILLLDGHAVVADFGIARAITQAADADSGGRASAEDDAGGMSGVIGTPAYMAPEQKRNERVDGRADLYALGVVAREMLYGRPAADSPAVAREVEPQFAALVEQLASPEVERRPACAADVVRALESLSSSRRRPAPWNGPHARWAISLAALCLVVIVTGIALRRGGAPGATRYPTIAVLPFVNVGSADDDHLGVGIAEELIGALTATGGVRVLGRTSTRAFVASELQPPTFGSSLGAASIVEGSVRRDAGRIHVTARLVDVDDGRIVWFATYDRDMEDFHIIRRDIARAIAAALQLRFRPDDTPTAPADPIAYESYLRGRYVLYTRLGRAGLLQAVDHFDDAVARAPDFARAWAGLANAHTLLGALGYGTPRVHFDIAAAAARRALELDGTIAEAHEARAHLLAIDDYAYGDAERAFGRALELDPGYTQARVAFAVLLQTQGRFDDALRQLDSARANDPLAPAVAAVRGRVLVSVGRPDSAIVALSEALQMNPWLDVAHQQLGFAHLQRGDTEEAIVALRAAASLSGPRDSAQLAYVYAVSGARAAADSIVRSLVARPEHHHVLPFHVAMAYTGLDMPDSAFVWLERGARERSSFMTGVAVTDAFKPLHADPRWRALLTTLKLVP